MLWFAIWVLIQALFSRDSLSHSLCATGYNPELSVSLYPCAASESLHLSTFPLFYVISPFKNNLLPLKHSTALCTDINFDTVLPIYSGYCHGRVLFLFVTLYIFGQSN